METITWQKYNNNMEEILKQIDLIEKMGLDTRTECFLMLVEVEKLKVLLLQPEVRVIKQKVWNCDNCSSDTNCKIQDWYFNRQWCDKDFGCSKFKQK